MGILMISWGFWTVAKTLESPLDCKEIQPVHPKGNQSWMFIGRTDAEAETPILWQPDVKNWLIEKTLMLGTIGGGRRRGWDGWMASLTQWTWVWVSSGSWWWTRRPGMLLSMGSQRVRHDSATGLDWLTRSLLALWSWKPRRALPCLSDRTQKSREAQRPHYALNESKHPARSPLAPALGLLWVFIKTFRNQEINNIKECLL